MHMKVIPAQIKDFNAQISGFEKGETNLKGHVLNFNPQRKVWSSFEVEVSWEKNTYNNCSIILVYIFLQEEIKG